MTCNTLKKTACTDETTWGRRITPRLKAGWQRFLQRRRQEATVHMLHGLDDRILSDIGLNRSEIESVVYSKAAGRRHRYVDAVWGASSRG